MKSGKKSLAVVFAAAALALGGAVALHGELQIWLQHLPAGHLVTIFFRPVSMPGGPVSFPRPVAETRVALTNAIALTPAVNNLYRLRAHEEELALDFTAAEADWRRFAAGAPNHAQSYTELADYYHRRERAAQEIAALQTVAAVNLDPVRPIEAQQPWRAVQRILSVVANEGVSKATSAEALEDWLKRHPGDAAGAKTAIDFYIAQKMFAPAQMAIDRYARQFPADLVYPVEERAALETARGSVEKALSIYDSSFEPLWPQELITAWFQLLDSQGRLREFLGKTRKDLQANPADLNATARLFAYWQRQNNQAEARRALVSYQVTKNSRHEPWTAADLWTLGKLFERLPDANEAARSYYAMYSVSGALPTDSERALAALANLLLTQPEQPIVFGSGDLSFYRDIATADSAPGFLNGILSLLFNSSSPRREYNEENAKSAAYFHRVSGARLVDLLSTRFPKSEYLADLRAGVVRAYAAYSDNEAVIRAGRQYLDAFPDGAQRVDVALLMADAFAALHRDSEEFALYDRLLGELAANARHVPLGDNASAQSVDSEPEKPVSGPRSPNYEKILDRYLDRLSTRNRPLDAVRVFRREIDQNPGDPGLYAKFAEFLDHNQLGKQVIETYRRAMARFPNRSWYETLARWYLRQDRTADFARLSREITETFSGSDLEKYFTNIVGTAKIDDLLYLQLNLYAHRKFPEDLQFVGNLIAAYSRPAISDDAAYRELIRTYWYFDDGWKRQYFQYLAESGALAPAMEEVRSNPAIANGNWNDAVAQNPAAVRFSAEAEAWLSHFEAAAPAFRAIAQAQPGDRPATTRAASIYRSLAAYDPANTRNAVDLTDFAHRANPRDRDALATEGDIYADRDQFSRARPLWNAILRIEPGTTESSLNAATIFWDYYLFNDALRILESARKNSGDTGLFAYQEGAIYEGRRDYSAAVQQYVAGAVAGDDASRRRLLRLASRKNLTGLVDQATAALTANPGTATAAARELRIALLEQQGRRDVLEAFLNSLLNLASNSAIAADVETVARRDGFTAVQERAAERQIALTLDPVERMQRQIDLVHFYEARQEIAEARQAMANVYRANPRVLGVVRAAVDFEDRQKNPDRALAILLEAAQVSRADLANQFELEAAQKSTAAGEFGRARGLLAALLKNEPYRAEYLAAEADTYAQAKDDAGFEKFTLEAIKTLQASPLPAETRTQTVVALRRALLPVLTRNSAFDRAVSQYIEIVNRYPEDEGVTREATNYAIAHGRIDPLRSFYRRTIHDSPRDYRWPIVLARIETSAEDYPAAITAYDVAMKDRPDRADLPEARATLEERILRFDEAIASYRKLYELTYRNPQWMEKIAELEARLGHQDEAVKCLRTALIGAGGETSGALFAIAAKLDEWNLVPEALSFAQRGAASATKQDQIPATYLRILARARQLQGLKPSEGNVAAMASVAAPVVESEYTPEEKLELERALGNQRDWLPFVEASALAPWQAQILQAQMGSSSEALQTFNQLQTRRGVYEELGREMETFSNRGPGGDLKVAARFDAANAYVAAGDRVDALRLSRALAASVSLTGPLEEWYLNELSRTDPSELVALAGNRVETRLRNDAAQYAIANNDAALALQAVAARGLTENALWKRAFTALTGLYFVDPEASVSTAFTSALGSGADIGARLRSPVDRTQQLAGTIWFYYGGRYGAYLHALGRPEATRFLPSPVELAPGNADAYFRLGTFFEESKQPGQAISRFRSALELNGDMAAAHDHIAMVLAGEGRKQDALTEWNAEISVLEQIQSRGVAVPEFFWPSATEMLHDIGDAGALGDLQPALARWISDYAQRNGSYRLEPLLTAAFDSAIGAHRDPAWILDIAVDRAGQPTILAFEQNAQLTPDQKIGLQKRRLQILEKELSAANGDQRVVAESALADQRSSLVAQLLGYGLTAQANQEWARIPAQLQRTHVTDAVLLAAANGTLIPLLTSYRAEQDQAPAAETLLQAVVALNGQKRHSDALLLEDFVYRRELDRQNLTPANFLGLAQADLDRKMNAEALALLRRMNRVAGEPFETFVPAAELLEKYNLNSEAAEFLGDRLRAVPWDSPAALRLAKLVNGAEQTTLLNHVVFDRNADYSVRAAAAQALAPRGASAATTGTELSILATGNVSIAAAEQPYRVVARAQAAHALGTPADAALKLMREALAINPGDIPTRNALIRLALANGRDQLALSLAETESPAQANVVAENESEPGAALKEDLSKAAERLNKLQLAISYEQKAIAGLTVPDGPAPDHARLDRLQSEENLRSMNRARAPEIGSSIEQKATVQPKLAGLKRAARSAQ